MTKPVLDATRFWTGRHPGVHPDRSWPIPANEQEAIARHEGASHPGGGDWLMCDTAACDIARKTLGYEGMGWYERAMRAEEILGYVPRPRKIQPRDD